MGESPLFYCILDFMPAVEKSELLQRITDLGVRASESTGIEIADIELKGSGRSRFLRVYIDKPGGVTHGDCEIISERLGNLLDVDNSIPEDSYTLEVSSLGVERPLSKPRDFERVLGQKIQVFLREPLENAKQFEGTLLNVANGVLELQLALDRRVNIPLDRLQKAKLKFEW